MLISIQVENYRSLKEPQVFSLEASPGKSKQENFFQAETKNGPLRLLKGAVVFGPNASGKSNFFKAISTIRDLITGSALLPAGESLKGYEPYRLDVTSLAAPIRFEFKFLIDAVRYAYSVGFSRNEITEEKLSYWPEGKVSMLFERLTGSAEFDEIRLGKSAEKTGIQRRLFKNQLFLSRFGTSDPHVQFTPVFSFFHDLEVWNASDSHGSKNLKREIEKRLAQMDKRSGFWKSMNRLISSADTGIQEIIVREAAEGEFNFPDFVPAEVKERFFQDNRHQTFARHTLFENGTPSGYADFDFEDESAGTQALFAIGGLLLQKLESGGTIFIDEFNNSLHPNLARFLVRLFMSDTANPHHAQLIIATHEIELITKDMFRKDQIWFTEKDKFGRTSLYSADDFEDVRDDSAFDRLYLNGKFQALPRLRTSAFLLQNPQA